MSSAAWPFGEYPPDGLEPLSPHVVAYYGDGGPVSNSAVVRGTEATLVFDANVLRAARALRSAVDVEDGPPLRHLVLSHVHDDHTLGAMHFTPPARVWSRSYTRDKLAGWPHERAVAAAGEYRDWYAGAEREAGDVRVVTPDAMVEWDERVDLGGDVAVHLRPMVGAAHTKGDLWAVVEPDGVALCGDLWFNDAEPYLASGSIRGATAAVDTLREARARAYLPGHGRAGRIATETGTDPVERYGAWLLDAVASGAAAGLSGVELEAAVRAGYDEQRARADGIRFRVAVPGFLEAGVEAAERELLEGG